MHSSIRPYTTGLAAIGASIIALSMVSAPPDVSRVDLAVTRSVEARVVQLAASTSATVVRPAAAPSVIAAPSVTNEAAAPTIGGTVRSIEVAALGVAIAAVWYLAAPVTIPLTVAALYLLSQIGSPQSHPNLGTYVVVFVALPFQLAAGLLPNTMNASAAAPSASRAINAGAAPGRKGQAASSVHTPKALGHAKKAAAARHAGNGRGAPADTHLSSPTNGARWSKSHSTPTANHQPGRR
jgi:hypothetical protein